MSPQMFASAPSTDKSWHPNHHPEGEEREREREREGGREGEDISKLDCVWYCKSPVMHTPINRLYIQNVHNTPQMKTVS